MKRGVAAVAEWAAFEQLQRLRGVRRPRREKGVPGTARWPDALTRNGPTALRRLLLRFATQAQIWCCRAQGGGGCRNVAQVCTVPVGRDRARPAPRLPTLPPTSGACPLVPPVLRQQLNRWNWSSDRWRCSDDQPDQNKQTDPGARALPLVQIVFPPNPNAPLPSKSNNPSAPFHHKSWIRPWDQTRVMH